MFLFAVQCIFLYPGCSRHYQDDMTFLVENLKLATGILGGVRSNISSFLRLIHPSRDLLVTLGNSFSLEIFGMEYVQVLGFHCLLGGRNAKIFGIFTPKIGEMIQFDDHIFQLGWFNHQLVYVAKKHFQQQFTTKLFRKNMSPSSDPPKQTQAHFLGFNEVLCLVS